VTADRRAAARAPTREPTDEVVEDRRRSYRPPEIRPFGRRLPAFGPPSPPPGEDLPPWMQPK
jgi:hypothetical protein